MNHRDTAWSVGVSIQAEPPILCSYGPDTSCTTVSTVTTSVPGFLIDAQSVFSNPVANAAAVFNQVCWIH